MPHYKSFYDRDYVFAFDLHGKDVTVVISKVTAGKLVAMGGRETKKPLVFFEGKEKPLALNATNGKTIAALYGTETDNWIGRPIKWRIICGARVLPMEPRSGLQLNGPLRFTSMTLSKSSSFMSRIVPPSRIPALLTRISSLPNFRTASSTSRLASIFFETSAIIEMALPPPAAFISSTALSAS